MAAFSELEQRNPALAGLTRQLDLGWLLGRGRGYTRQPYKKGGGKTDNDNAVSCFHLFSH